MEMSCNAAGSVTRPANSEAGSDPSMTGTMKKIRNVTMLTASNTVAAWNSLRMRKVTTEGGGEGPAGRIATRRLTLSLHLLSMT